MALGGCSEAPADGQCQKLLTHLIDLEVQAGQGSDEEKAKQAAELQETMAKSFLERCERDIKAKQIKCSLKATTKKEIEACDK